MSDSLLGTPLPTLSIYAQPTDKAGDVVVVLEDEELATLRAWHNTYTQGAKRFQKLYGRYEVQQGRNNKLLRQMLRGRQVVPQGNELARITDEGDLYLVPSEVLQAQPSWHPLQGGRLVGRLTQTENRRIAEQVTYLLTLQQQLKEEERGYHALYLKLRGLYEELLGPELLQEAATTPLTLHCNLLTGVVRR